MTFQRMALLFVPCYSARVTRTWVCMELGTSKTRGCILSSAAIVFGCSCQKTKKIGSTCYSYTKIGAKRASFRSSDSNVFRVKHGPQESVPEGLFDDSIDLVIWGHEHDCRIRPEPVAGKRYFISQPGSSVATSLAEGEAVDKCALITPYFFVWAANWFC